MIVIIDYGLGNINAFMNVFRRLEIPVRIARESKDLEGAGKVILPGVGAFDYAMKRLNDSGMRSELDKLALEKKIPFIGICVGMQILAASSEEGVLPGLGYIRGVNRKFKTAGLTHKTKLPHMGWNEVKPKERNGLFSSVVADPLFYFLHSYHLECDNMDDILATSTYGCEFVSSVKSGNIYGVQFHPEKSHLNGIMLLKNFANL